MDLPRVPPELLVAAAGVAALLALVQTLRLAFRSSIARRRIALARERGALGEARAEGLLRKLGFTILGRQVVGGYGLGVDGERLAVDLRADYLVAADGRRFIAEVKTGVFAPRLDTAATRRQLLEYRIAFDALEIDGVLLVDAEAGRVHAVEFPLPAGDRGGPAAGWLGWLAWMLGVVAGVAAGALAALAFVARAR